MQYPPELIQALINAGQDPSEFLMSKAPTEDKVIKSKVVDPLEERLMKLEDENLVAFRLAKEGYDTVYNIGERWTYNMVRECQEYLDAVQEYQEREYKKAERNNK